VCALLCRRRRRRRRCRFRTEGMSKRVTLQQKYKIQKRCKEYTRKLKKAGKKLGPNGGEWKSKKEACQCKQGNTRGMGMRATITVCTLLTTRSLSLSLCRRCALFRSRSHPERLAVQGSDAC